MRSDNALNQFLTEYFRKAKPASEPELIIELDGLDDPRLANLKPGTLVKVELPPISWRGIPIRVADKIISENQSS